MVDRLDLVTILAYVADAMILGVIFAIAGPSVTSPGVGLGALFIAISIFPFAYPAYRAFDIRRALRIRLYRNRALGIGLVCVAYVAGALDNTGTAYGIFILVVLY